MAVSGSTAWAPRGAETWFGKAEMLDLAFGDEVLHGAGDILNRHFGVRTVLVEKIDAIGPETLERALDRRFHPLRTAVEAAHQAKLRRNDNLMPKRRHGLAHNFFVEKRTVDLRRIEERHSLIERRPHDANHGGPVLRGIIEAAHW